MRASTDLLRLYHDAYQWALGFGNTVAYLREDHAARVTVSLAAHHAKVGRPPMARPKLLAEVERLCAEETAAHEPDGDDLERLLQWRADGLREGEIHGRADLLESLEAWLATGEMVGDVRVWIANQRAAISPTGR